jgi:hypothetical protein
MPLNVWTFLIESINDAIKIIYTILHPANITCTFKLSEQGLSIKQFYFSTFHSQEVDNYEN